MTTESIVFIVFISIVEIALWLRIKYLKRQSIRIEPTQILTPIEEAYDRILQNKIKSEKYLFYIYLFLIGPIIYWIETTAK